MTAYSLRIGLDFNRLSIAHVQPAGSTLPESGARLPLERIAGAQERVESGRGGGKVVLEL
jgi:hypothetical protein